MSTLGHNLPQDEGPEDLKVKLSLLEDDRKAHYEASQHTIRKNKELIASLKKENKALTQNVKEAKTMARSQSAVTRKDPLVKRLTSSKTKANDLKHSAQQKEKRIEKLQKQLKELQLEEEHQVKANGGASNDMQRLRTLENSLDKTLIKMEEAQHVGKTYNKIIKKLEQDRLQFDNSITKVEKAIEHRKQELVTLEAMCKDACANRDVARAELQKKEKNLAKARKEREEEKKKLKVMAEDRRRQFEAMEKRMRIASAHLQSDKEDQGHIDDFKERLENYEDAMKRIRDATGATDINEVVERFLTQDDTNAHLQEVYHDNVEVLQKLKEDREHLDRQFEALKYSGEARSTGNQRMLAEFESHLRNVESACNKYRDGTERCTRVLVSLHAGIEALYEKLGSIKPVQFRAASNVQDKLTESELRLKKLHDELESRKSELPSGLDVENIPRVLPEHNTRIALDDEPEEDESDSDDDDEFASRDAIKKQALALVDDKTNKKKGRRKKA
eukprot:m.105236 g.105236  ORF g.105236 m.105236 type:complete len:503 (-) comp12652_c0_seq4:1755-3263(-)